MQRWCFLILVSLLVVAPCVAQTRWQRHAIDDSLRGADGVRLADFNRDGLPDVVCGWEQSGIVRLYLNPGANKQWVETIKFEVLGNLRTDFTMLTYTNQPSRNRPEQAGETREEQE